MARYIKAPDLWDADTKAALDAGTLKLQSGQWIRCGGNVPSRFHHNNPATGYVMAFHGHAKGSGQASRRYLAYVHGCKEEEAARLARIADRERLAKMRLDWQQGGSAADPQGALRQIRRLERKVEQFDSSGYTVAGREYAKGHKG